MDQRPNKLPYAQRRRLAKAHIYQYLLVELVHHIDNGSEWLYELCDPTVPNNAIPEAHQISRKLMKKLVLEIADEIRHKVAKLS